MKNNIFKKIDKLNRFIELINDSLKEAQGKSNIQINENFKKLFEIGLKRRLIQEFKIKIPIPEENNKENQINIPQPEERLGLPND